MRDLDKTFFLFRNLVWVKESEIDPKSQKVKVRWFAHYTQVLKNKGKLVDSFVRSSDLLYAYIFLLTNLQLFPEGDEESISLFKKILDRIEKAIGGKLDEEIEIIYQVLPYKTLNLFENLTTVPSFLRFQLCFIICYTIFALKNENRLSCQSLKNFFSLPQCQNLKIMVSLDEKIFGLRDEEETEEIIIYKPRKKGV